MKQISYEKMPEEKKKLQKEDVFTKKEEEE